MRLIEIEQTLLKLKQPVLQTRDVSACLKISKSQASKILERLEQAGKFVRLMRGKFATTKELDPLILPEYLTAPFPTYISLQTALFYHGMISQIPQIIYAVSLARTRKYNTPFGGISIHHLQPDFFFDFNVVGQFKLATMEKALIDFLYLSASRSTLFKKLPEVEFPAEFDVKKAKKIIQTISAKRVRGLVENQFYKLFTLAKTFPEWSSKADDEAYDDL